MRKRYLGATGLQVSEIGFGCGTVGGLMTRGSAAEQERAVATALDCGVNYFDTAAQYGDGTSETNLGQVFTKMKPDVVIATKVKVPAVEPTGIAAAITASLEASLGRLGRDHVDLLQLHNTVADAPEAGGLTTDAVLDHVVPAFERLVREGKIRFFGMTALGQTAALHRLVDARRFATAQVPLNLLNPTPVRGVPPGYPAQDYDRLLQRMTAADMGGVSIRVLAAGALSGGTPHPLARDGARPMGSGSSFAVDAARAEKFQALVAEGHAVTLAGAAIRYALSYESISVVLIGMSGAAQIVDAADAAAAGPLSADALARAEQIQDGLVGEPR